MQNSNQIINVDFTYLKKIEPITIIGHENLDTDSIISCVLLHKLLDFKGIKNMIKRPDKYTEPDVSGVDISAFPVVFSKKETLFLVDHCKIYENKIAGCIDHHPCSFIPCKKNYFTGDNSSCAKIIYDLMQQEKYPITKDIIYLTVLSLFCDTQSFKLQSKVNLLDVVWCKEMIDYYKWSYNDFYKKGIDITNLDVSTDKLIYNSYKKLYIPSCKCDIGTSCLVTEFLPDFSLLKNLTQQAVKEINKYNLGFWLILATELERERSLVIEIYSNGDYKITYYGFVISRGRDIIKKYF